ncbi:hypothetical protein BDW75DRAFT_245727 [Aspergillus navahoensis]
MSCSSWRIICSTRVNAVGIKRQQQQSLRALRPPRSPVPECSIFPDAEVLYSLARTHYTQNEGPAALPTLAALNELARTYSAQGRYKEAATMGLLSLTGFIDAVGPDDLRVCMIRETLGNTYEHLDLPEKAEDIHTEALEGYRESLQPSHHLTVECLDRLVGFYIGWGRNGDGRCILEKQLADCRAAFTPESVSFTHDIKDVSLMYLTGKDAAAGALDIEKKTPRASPLSARRAYRSLHGTNGAEETLWEAVASHETFLGSNHYTTQRSVYYLGIVYERQGFPRAAETLWRGAMANLAEFHGYGDRKLMRWVQFRLDRLRDYGIGTC